uniref:Uncharacterized protein n=1 Tax=Vespula pensylvanica TaxID=30213 RepID=A0A834P7F1_VESPE|nr:hypothetical protein H0235_004406 [Vespula pensylvanica]
MFKVKTVKLVEDKDNISTEELISPVLLDILNNLLLVKANINVFVLKNKLEDIPKDVIVSESNMIEMDLFQDLKALNSLKLTLYFGPLETDLVTNVNSLKNTIEPIVRTVFSQDQIHVALKFMTAGNHLRKDSSASENAYTAIIAFVIIGRTGNQYFVWYNEDMYGY